MNKLKITEIIEEAGEDFEISEVTLDADFKTLGLVVSNLDLPFCTFLDNIKYLNCLEDNVKMVITTPEISKAISNRGVCISNKPRISFFKMHNYLSQTSYYRMQEEFDTQIGTNCNISKYAHIANKNVKIGNNVTIEEFASIKEGTIIDNGTFIGAGTKIGGEGFEFKRMDNMVMDVIHCGGVKIGENVSIQYNTCIDKAIYPWDSTVINKNSKLDNLVQIAHAVKLGENTLVAGGAAIAGRVVVGKNSWIGPQSVISNGLTVGDGCHIGLGSVVLSNLEDNVKVFGNPARIYDKSEKDNKLKRKQDTQKPKTE